MKTRSTVALLSGIVALSAALATQADPTKPEDDVEFAAHPEPMVSVGTLVAAASNYVGTVVSATGKITKLETEGTGGDSFLVVVDSLLEAHVNTRVMLTPTFDHVDMVTLYQPPVGLAMLCVGPPATMMNGEQSPGTRLFGIGDDVIVRGTLRLSGDRLAMDATSMRTNSNPVP